MLIDPNVERDTLPKSCFAEEDIIFEEGQFLLQCDHLFVFEIENGSVDLTEFKCKLYGIIGLVRYDAGECIEGVEKEVWVHLIAECLQLRARGGVRQSLGLGHAFFPIVNEVSRLVDGGDWNGSEKACYKGFYKPGMWEVCTVKTMIECTF